jgi:hypothetical protein
MATRLYPVTEKPEVLEALADVPRGTYWALQVVSVMNADRWPLPKMVRDSLYRLLDDLAMRHFEFLHHFPNLEQLDNFIQNGWGRARSSVCFTEPRYAIGNSTDTAEVAEILAAQGVILPPGLGLADLGGVRWG